VLGVSESGTISIFVATGGRPRVWIVIQSRLRGRRSFGSQRQTLMLLLGAAKRGTNRWRIGTTGRRRSAVRDKSFQNFGTGYTGADRGWAFRREKDDGPGREQTAYVREYEVCDSISELWKQAVASVRFLSSSRWTTGP
jgi:hypothetical protein